jgi:hypothetical protein
MKVRVKQNPKFKPILKTTMPVYRAEYQSVSDDKWYPIIDRRYNMTKRQATRIANAHKHRCEQTFFRSTPTTQEDITFTLVSKV